MSSTNLLSAVQSLDAVRGLDSFLRRRRCRPALASRGRRSYLLRHRVRLGALVDLVSYLTMRDRRDFRKFGKWEDTQ